MQIIINTANGNAKVAEIIGSVGNIDALLKLMRWAVANDGDCDANDRRMDCGQVYDTDTGMPVKDETGEDVYYDDLDFETEKDDKAAEQVIRVGDIDAAYLRDIIDAQGTYAEPDAGQYFAASVLVRVEGEDASKSVPYRKDWTQDELYACPEVKNWLKERGMEDWSEEDLAGYDIGEIFSRSDAYLSGLEEIICDIKSDFASDDRVTIN